MQVTCLREEEEEEREGAGAGFRCPCRGNMNRSGQDGKQGNPASFLVEAKPWRRFSHVSHQRLLQGSPADPLGGA